MNEPERDHRPAPIKALEMYRQHSPLALLEEAKALRRMPERDRTELLFYMISHATMALQQRDDAPARAFKDVDRLIRGGDA
jgi:hypothetical protein